MFFVLFYIVVVFLFVLGSFFKVFVYDVTDAFKVKCFGFGLSLGMVRVNFF